MEGMIDQVTVIKGLLEEEATSVAMNFPLKSPSNLSSFPSIYDRLTAMLCLNEQFSLLDHVYVSGTRKGYGNNETFLKQHVISLFLAKEHKKAFTLLQHLLKDEVKDPLVYYTVAEVALYQLHQYIDAVKYAELGLQYDKDGLFRLGLLKILGIAHATFAKTAFSKEKRLEHQNKAIDYFETALITDPKHFELLYESALLFAETRQITRAFERVRAALEIYPQEPHCLHLCALLLSSQKKYEEASKIMLIIQSEHTMDINALLTKAIIEEVAYGVDYSLATFKEAFMQWRSLYGYLHSVDAESTSNFSLPDILENKTFMDLARGMSISSLQSKSYSDRIARELSNHALTNRRSLLLPMKNPHFPCGESTNTQELDTSFKEESSRTLSTIWLLCAELFLRQGNEEDAFVSVNEALLNYPLSSDVYCMFGRYYWYKKEYEQAIAKFQRALALDSEHVKSYVYLGLLMLEYDPAHQRVLQVPRMDPPSSDEEEDDHEEIPLAESSLLELGPSPSLRETIPFRFLSEESNPHFPSMNSSTSSSSWSFREPKEGSLVGSFGSIHEKRRLDRCEHAFQSAIRTDPYDHEAWYGLGLVFQQTHRLPASLDCFIHSLHLEKTHPLRSYDKVGHITPFQ